MLGKDFKDFNGIETGMQKLENAVDIRNQMRGALYFNIVNGDCAEIADKLCNMGADVNEVSAILNR